MFGRRGEIILDVFAVTLTGAVGTIILGRALNSQTALNLQGLPFVGAPIAAVTAAWNQHYDRNGED